MDSSVISYLSIGISITGLIISAINHRHIRSSCCGKKYEASIDIDKTQTPPKQTPFLNSS
jgi:hypothetical protein